MTDDDELDGIGTRDVSDRAPDGAGAETRPRMEAGQMATRSLVAPA
jgi:hypothetical protein